MEIFGFLFFLFFFVFFFVFFGFFGVFGCFCFFWFLWFFWFRSSAFPSPSNLRQIRELKLQLILLSFLWDQKKHLQGTGASIFLKSIIFLFLIIFVVDKDLSKNSCLTHATTVLSAAKRSGPKKKNLISSAVEIRASMISQRSPDSHC